MSDRLRGDRKRGVASDDEDVGDKPAFADAETMAQRRIVRVVRTTPAGPPPSLGGIFKSLPSALPTGTPPLVTKFGSVASGSASSSGISPPPLNGAFPFIPKPTEGAAPAFAMPKVNAMTATDFSSTAAGTITNTGDGNKTDTKPEVGGGLAGTGSLFGGAHSFGNAVNSFVAAKERLAKAAEETDDKGATVDSPVSPTPGDALANADPVSVATGEVVATIPSKLYLFKSDTKSWSDCGVGEAKIKKHESNGGEDKSGGSPKYFYRLIVRDGYALNTPLSKNFILTKSEDTHATFSFPVGTKVVTYLLKYTGANAAECGPAFSKALKETLKLAQEQSK
ncbi:hypothetical protein, conserved [Trypanosoma brucei brucei TREU927]|uniref:RanBD1 domain-containing protein n=1 Tax=Trypanosoma brucei brucei (strain 927/4 GUTat10.1) TaxID=185431 RepID=Q38AA7_TRYB2|nr:hypothetical protein, conserved [Trypanosoma brucei brucei TREU927]EAN78263.1 hypothetical protein, conserved [Trypanosoma brucei brucei TREU927]